MKQQKLECSLSPLETEVLTILWKHKRLKVREIHDILAPTMEVALTSVAVILDRLHAKGVVGRDIEGARGGLRYIYFPLQNKKEFEKTLVEETVNKLIEKFGTTAVSYFNERFSK